MIKVYGKGSDTVNDSEYWDGRTTYNAINQFLADRKEDAAIRNILTDSLDSFSILESTNKNNFIGGGVVASSFENEFTAVTTDFTTVITGEGDDEVTRHYIRCSPGIAFNAGHAYINKPAIELAAAELKEILKLKEEEETIDIKFNYSDRTFKCKIEKIIDEHIKIFEFTNDTNYNNDTEAGYNTGIEMIGVIANDPDLSSFISDAIGDKLTKIDLELTKEVTDFADDTYAWVMLNTGLIDLKLTSAIDDLTELQLNQLSVSVSTGSMTIDTYDPVLFGDTQGIDGDLIVNGDITATGDITAARVYNAVWGDIAEYFYRDMTEDIKPGDVFYADDGFVKKSNKINDKKVVGVYSDTFGYGLGSEDKEKKVPIGLSGRVNVKIKEQCKLGDLLISGKDGYSIVKRWYHFGNNVIGKVLENKTDKETKRVSILIK